MEGIPLSQWGQQSPATTGSDGPVPVSQWGLDPSQSAALLGHATGMMLNTFKTPLNYIQEGNTQGATDFAKGALKQAAGDISMAGAQHAGPVGQAMLAHAPGFQQNVAAFDKTVQPTNEAQSQGGGMTTLGEALIPSEAALSVASDGSMLSKTAEDLSQKSGLSKFLSDWAQRSATKAIQSTPETMTKGERLAAIQEGRQVPTLLGGAKFEASPTELKAGELLAGKMKGNPVKNVPIIQSEIKSLGQEAENYLAQNAKPISNAEDFSAFAKQRDITETYLTPTAQKAYDDMINVFQKTLKNHVGEGGYNTSNYYQALKDFEQNVTQNLPKGKEALLDEGGSARLQAAKDVRKVVRDMIGQKDSGFKPKMFNLASLYDALDNATAKAEKVGKSGLKEFANRHPYLTGAATFAGGETLYNKAKQALGL